MMPTISKLPTDLANKIAAGEVVERPASVVKELMENAIDANATRIEVHVKEGGLELIKVIDNGDGMESEDVELALYRHATSKVKTERDLFHIKTLGFRGEALPSIAAVSKLDIETGTEKGIGTLVRYQGGKKIAFRTAKGRKGTEVTVRELFFNTPARLKYMKSIHTEIGHISDIIHRLALAHPNISIRLVHNERELFFSNGNGSAFAVLASIYGRKTAQQFVSWEEKSTDYHIRAYIAKPEIYRANRQYISVFINGRYVRHFAITKAIEEGYHTLLPIGKHPIAVLYITMDPILVDVNVHPSKLEVRLSKEKELTALITEGIKQTLRQERLIPSVEKRKRKEEKSEQLTFPLEREMKIVNIPYGKEKIETPPSSIRESMKRNENDDLPLLLKEKASKKEEAPSSVPEKNETSTPSEPVNREKIPPLEYVGQLHGTYIIAQSEEGMYMIDQHAAQERIFYEFYREKIGETSRELQDLLVPMTLELSPSEESMYEQFQAELEEVGIFLEPFGERTYRISSHPTWFPEGEAENIIRELLEQLLREKRISIQQLREEAAILMACKRAIKANRYLRKDEIEALLDQLRECDSPYTCPHGRPVVVHFSTYEIEKMFKRVMT